MEQEPYAPAFFVPFTIVTSFTVLNLFIALIVNTLQSAQEQDREFAETEARVAHDECEPLFFDLFKGVLALSNARGSGSRGVRDAGWDTSRNVRIEVVCAADVAERIETRLRDGYFESYAMICFTSDVEVMRSAKF